MIKIKKFLSFTKNWLLDIIPDFIDFLKVGNKRSKEISAGGKGRGGFILFIFIILPFILYYVSLSLIALIYTGQIYFWESTNGILIQKEPFLVYSYEIGDKKYASNTYDQMSIIRNKNNILKYKGKDFDINQSLRIYYNPKNHQESVINRKLDINFGGGIFIISLISIWCSTMYRKKFIKLLVLIEGYALVLIVISTLLSFLD